MGADARDDMLDTPGGQAAPFKQLGGEAGALAGVIFGPLRTDLNPATDVVQERGDLHDFQVGPFDFGDSARQVAYPQRMVPRVASGGVVEVIFSSLFEVFEQRRYFFLDLAE